MEENKTPAQTQQSEFENISIRSFQKMHSKIVKDKQARDKKYGCKEEDYAIKGLLGKGGFGHAYKVKAKNSKTYVLKKIPIWNINSKKQRIDTLNEVKMLQNIKHQHIIKVYHSFIDTSYFYILTEYAPGGDLYQLVQQRTKDKKGFSQNQLWKWAYEILLAIRYLHDNCIIHWDLKASNIFITKKNRIKIGDFGSSRILDPAKMYLKEDLGTTTYCSPEQINYVGLYDYKIDVWAFGCCMYYLTAFKPPFSGSNFSDLSYNINNTEPAKLSESWDLEYLTLISKCLTKSSKERPTAMELCLCIPSSVINNYTPPKIPTLASLTFMNPTKSTIEREKSTSKTELKDLYMKIGKSSVFQNFWRFPSVNNS